MTYSGTRFDLLNPDPNNIKLEDIAHALSQIIRFTGHCSFPYSVGQHCLLGAYKMLSDGHSYRLQLLFMLHDATEAWYSDINRPLKRLLPQYVELEDKAMSAVWDAFTLSPPTKEEWDVVKYYDDLMLSNEITRLMKHHEQFEVEPRNDSDIEISPMRMEEIEMLYYNTVLELLKKVI